MQDLEYIEMNDIDESNPVQSRKLQKLFDAAKVIMYSHLDILFLNLFSLSIPYMFWKIASYIVFVGANRDYRRDGTR